MSAFGSSDLDVSHREIGELTVRELPILPADSVATAIGKSVASKALKGIISAAADPASGVQCYFCGDWEANPAVAAGDARTCPGVRQRHTENGKSLIAARAPGHCRFASSKLEFHGAMGKSLPKFRRQECEPLASNNWHLGNLEVVPSSVDRRGPRAFAVPEPARHVVLYVCL